MSSISIPTNLSSMLKGKNDSVLEVDIEKITPDSTNVRTVSNDGLNDDSLMELANSIKSIGVTQPLILRRGDTNDSYIVVCGERRLRASKLAGKTTVPAIVREFKNEQEIKICQITENIQRVDLDPFEIANVIHFLKSENNLKTAEISKVLGKTESFINYSYSFFNMPPFLLNLYKSGNVSMSPRVCYELRKLYDEYPTLFEQWINDIKVYNEIIERSHITQLKDFINHRTGKTTETINIKSLDAEKTEDTFPHVISDESNYQNIVDTDTDTDVSTDSEDSEQLYTSYEEKNEPISTNTDDELSDEIKEISEDTKEVFENKSYVSNEISKDTVEVSEPDTATNELAQNTSTQIEEESVSVDDLCGDVANSLIVKYKGKNYEMALIKLPNNDNERCILTSLENKEQMIKVHFSKISIIGFS